MIAGASAMRGLHIRRTFPGRTRERKKRLAKKTPELPSSSVVEDEAKQKYVGNERLC
jgi:hypothetical protein